MAQAQSTASLAAASARSKALLYAESSIGNLTGLLIDDLNCQDFMSPEELRYVADALGVLRDLAIQLRAH